MLTRDATHSLADVLDSSRTLLFRWWTQFTAWAGVDGKEGTLSFVPRGPYRDIPVGPGPIINNDLLVDDDPAKVKQGLKDPDDYVCRSEETWEYLQKLHGEYLACMQHGIGNLST